MRLNRNRILSFIVLGIFIILLVIFLPNKDELLESAAKVPVWIFFVVVVSRLMFLGANGLILKIVAAKFSTYLRFIEWFGLVNITTMTNYVAPFSGGMLVRAAYLKRRHAFPYGQFMTMLAAIYLILFLVVGIVGVIASLIIFMKGGEAWIPMAFFLVVSAAGSTILLLPHFQITDKNRITRTLNNSLKGWRLVKRDKGLIIRLGALTFVIVLLNGLAYWIVYTALDATISFEGALIVSLLPMFTQVFRITPANIGLQEATVAVTSEIIGVGAELGLLVALIIRASMIIPVFILGSLFSFLLSRDLKSDAAVEFTSSADGQQIISTLDEKQRG